jgi:acetyl-CoA carboxylase carboxyl transferase subunit beta
MSHGRQPPPAWREAVLRNITWRDDVAGPPVNRLRWPGYEDRTALRIGRGEVAGHDVLVAVWDFRIFGGSFGERDATAFLAVVDDAIRTRRPLLTITSSGGTRLQEGVAALIGMARATTATRRLAEAAVPHIAIADSPTTGGVWTTVASRADVRAAVAGATVGFGGPRVVEVVTGTPPGPGSHTAESAGAHGLVDAVLAAGHIPGWLASALDVLDATDPALAPPAPPDEAVAGNRDGWEQVRHARSTDRPDGRDLLARVLTGGVGLRGADGSVVARIGHLAGIGSVAGVALAAHRAGRPTPAGYRLLTRTALLADRLRLPLVTLVDTPGAEPGPAAEAAGLAPAIGEAMDAVLSCRSPSVALLHGEGGSGGALAATCCDRVLVTPDGYMAALGPEPAAVTLRRTPQEAATLQRVGPKDLRALGFADRLIDGNQAAVALAAEIAALASGEVSRRDWSRPLSGSCD